MSFASILNRMRANAKAKKAKRKLRFSGLVDKLKARRRAGGTRTADYSNPMQLTEITNDRNRFL